MRSGRGRANAKGRRSEISKTPFCFFKLRVKCSMFQSCRWDSLASMTSSHKKKPRRQLCDDELTDVEDSPYHSSDNAGNEDEDSDMSDEDDNRRKPRADVVVSESERAATRRRLDKAKIPKWSHRQALEVEEKLGIPWRDIGHIYALGEDPDTLYLLTAYIKYMFE